MKAAQQDNLINTEQREGRFGDSALRSGTLYSDSREAITVTLTSQWLRKFGMWLLLVPDYQDWVPLICSAKGTAGWKYWYWKEKVCKHVLFQAKKKKNPAGRSSCQIRERCSLQIVWEAAPCPWNYLQLAVWTAGTLEDSGSEGKDKQTRQAKHNRREGNSSRITTGRGDYVETCTVM